MNSFELLGRMSVLQLDSKKLLCEINDLLDKKRVDLLSDQNSAWSRTEVSLLESRLLEMLDNYNEYISYLKEYSDNNYLIM